MTTVFGKGGGRTAYGEYVIGHRGILMNLIVWIHVYVAIPTCRCVVFAQLVLLELHVFLFVSLLILCWTCI